MGGRGARRPPPTSAIAFVASAFIPTLARVFVRVSDSWFAIILANRRQRLEILADLDHCRARFDDSIRGRLLNRFQQ
jgi:hypothetical protein